MSKTKRQVVRADQSPMNEKRWLLTLSCGHETWVTRSRAPTLGTKVECETCRRTLPARCLVCGASPKTHACDEEACEPTEGVQ